VRKEAGWTNRISLDSRESLMPEVNEGWINQRTWTPFGSGASSGTGTQKTDQAEDQDLRGFVQVFGRSGLCLTNNDGKC
jgi:hypothetical protein